MPRKPNVSKVMIMAEECFGIKLKPIDAQMVVNLLVEDGIETILFLAKKPPRNLIAFVRWIFPRIRWGLNMLNVGDREYDDYKRAGREDDYRSEGRDPMIHFRKEDGRIDWKKFDKDVSPLGKILERFKK